MLQSAALFLTPIRKLLGLAPTGVADALVALAAGSIPFIANEGLKTLHINPDGEANASVRYQK